MKFRKLDKSEAKRSLVKACKAERATMESIFREKGLEFRDTFWNQNNINRYVRGHAQNKDSTGYMAKKNGEEVAVVFIRPEDNLFEVIISKENIDLEEYRDIFVGCYEFMSEVANDMDLDYMKTSHADVEEIHLENYFDNTFTVPNMNGLVDYASIRFFDHRGVEFIFNGTVNTSEATEELRDKLGLDVNVTSMRKGATSVVHIPFDKDNWRHFVTQADEYSNTVDSVIQIMEDRGLKHVSHNLEEKGSLMHKTRENKEPVSRELAEKKVEEVASRKFGGLEN